MARTVLICDDSESIRQLVAAVLAEEGYDLTQAGTFDEAVAALESGAPPDLVITDVHMPGGGTAVIEWLRADPDLSDTPVLLVSGSVQALNGRWAQSVGADGHLAKPFGLEELKSKVRELLGAT